MARYYRIHPQAMTESDCHTGHVSRLWTGEDERPGLSVCRSAADLLDYFAGQPGETSVCRAARLEGAHLVVVEGEDTGAAAWEGDIEALVHPTRIISSTPVSDGWIDELIEYATDRWCDADERLAYRGGEIVREARCETCEGIGAEDGDECIDCDGRGWS